MGLRPQVPVPSTPQNEDVSHQRGRLSCAVRNAAPSSQGGRESRTQKLFAISQAQVLLSVATMIISSVLVLGPSPTSFPSPLHPRGGEGRPGAAPVSLRRWAPGLGFVLLLLLLPPKARVRHGGEGRGGGSGPRLTFEACVKRLPNGA